MCNNIKNKIYDEKLKELSSSFVRCDLYVDRLTKITHRCTTCGTEKLMAPRTILEGGGCRKCYSKKITKTNEEYDKQLHTVTPTIIRIEDYTTNNKKIKHRCLVCGYAWFIRPQDALYGKHQCAFCLGRVVDNEKYDKKLSDKNPTII